MFPFDLLKKSSGGPCAAVAVLLAVAVHDTRAQDSGTQPVIEDHKEPRALPCYDTAEDIKAAVVALVAYGQPGPPLTDAPDAAQQNVWKAFTALLAAPESDLESLCPVLPVDRPVAVPQAGRPESRETLLTAAVKTGQVAFVQAALKVETNAKGNVYATNGEHQAAYQLAQGDVARKYLNKLNPIPVPWPVVEGKDAPGVWARIQTAGSTGVVAPDVDDSTKRIPQYVSTLVASQQGVSIGAASQNGTASPKIQGEVRYTLRRTSRSDDAPQERFVPDDYIGRAFLYANGNVNSNKNPDKPTSPDWAGLGIGYKVLFDGRDGSVVANSQRWIEVRTKLGDVENLLQHHRGNYIVSNSEVSAFFPLAGSIQSSDTGKRLEGAAAYLGLSLGAQAQKKQSGVAVPDPRSVYSFERVDVYAYPLWLVGSLFESSDNPSCFSGKPGWLSHECSIVTLHLDRQVANNRLGSLNEYSVSWGFRKGLSLVFTRSVGVQDPISSFGVRLPRSAQSQISLKITPSTGGGD